MTLSKTLSIYIPTLYVLTAIYYTWYAGGNLLRQMAIPTNGFYFAACSLFDILVFDAIGLYVWRKYDALTSFVFVVFVGAMQLWSWSPPVYITVWSYSYFWSWLLEAHNVVFFSLFVVLGPLTFLWLRKRIVWRLNWLFFPFLALYPYYFLVLKGIDHTGIFIYPMEAVFEGLLDLAFFSGLLPFWRVFKD